MSNKNMEQYGEGMLQEIARNMSALVLEEKEQKVAVVSSSSYSSLSSVSSVSSSSSLSSVSASTHPEDEKGRDIQTMYEEAGEKLYSELVKPVLFKDYEGRQIALIFKHGNAEQTDRLKFMGYDQFKCRTCGYRAASLGVLSTSEGQVLFHPKRFVLKKYDQHVQEMSRLAGLACQTKITEAILVTAEDFMQHPRSLGRERDPWPGSDFKHWAVHVAPEHLTSSKMDKDRIVYAFHRYIADGLLERLITTLLANGPAAAIASLNLMEKCCDKIPYANVCLKTVRWLRSMAEHPDPMPADPLVRAERHAQFLFSQYIGVDLNGSHCPSYHQANLTVMKLMAEAKDEADMLVKLTEVFSPSNYKRPDTSAVITEGEIAIAQKHLGEFTNSIMTTKQLEEVKGCIKLNIPVEHGSLDGFQKMRAGLKKPKEPLQHKQGPGGFAARSGIVLEDEEKYGVIKASGKYSWTEVAKYLRGHPDTTVEVNTNFGKVCYIAATTLPAEKRKFPHFWAFLNDRSPAEHGMNKEWARVTHIQPVCEHIRKGPLAFVVQGAQYTCNKGNCNFPDFLVPELERVCRKAFERLNEITPIQVPQGEALALGMGTSIAQEDGTFALPIKLKIDGKTINVFKL